MVPNTELFFDDRHSAGVHLSEELNNYPRSRPVVVSIPRGGVPVAVPIANELDVDLDVIVVKKLGAPGNKELAIGAVGEEGEPYLNQETLASLDVDDSYLREEVKSRHRQVMELAEAFRSVSEQVDLTNRSVILVDDGIATGATVRVCIQLIDQRDPESITLAVPVAPVSRIDEIVGQTPVDQVICPQKIQGFFGGVGRYYEDFAQVSTDDVKQLLSSFG